MIYSNLKLNCWNKLVILFMFKTVSCSNNNLKKLEKIIFSLCLCRISFHRKPFMRKTEHSLHIVFCDYFLQITLYSWMNEINIKKMKNPFIFCIDEFKHKIHLQICGNRLECMLIRCLGIGFYVHIFHIFTTNLLSCVMMFAARSFWHHKIEMQTISLAKCFD